jgi:Xaa-Pro aminopeptidase
MTAPTPATLPVADHARRQQRLRDGLAPAGVEALVVTTPENVRYLTGFSGSNGQVLVSADTTVLVTDGRYEQRAATEAPSATLVIDRDWQRQVVRHAVDARLDQVGFEAHHLTYADGQQLSERLDEDAVVAVPTAHLAEQLRRVKDGHELAALATACAITSQAFEALLEHLAPGRTERELARILWRMMEDLGAEATAFDSIVASGPNSAVPHHQPTDRALRPGELLKLDFGARYAGYHADMTRTVSLGDPVDEELVRIHDLVREAQQRGVETATGEHTVGEVDAACRDHLTEAGYGDRFVHGTGHGVGLAIHEAPWVSRGASDILVDGIVITVEPGIYLPGRGGVRIEDTVAITADGSPRRLTAAPRELLRL